MVSLVSSILWLTLASAPTSATPKSNAPWPQFRGPEGQGHISGPAPTSWSSDANVVWSAKIPGKGWSSPIVAEGKVWMTTAVPVPGKGGADADGKGKKEPLSLRVVAVDERTGKLTDDIEVFAVTTPQPLHGRNSSATPSPVYDAGRLYVQFGSDGVAAIDTASGKVAWTNQSLKLDYETGPASSPVVYKDLLIIPCDGADVQFAVALKTSDGSVVWKTERNAALAKGKSSRRAFATPLVITVDGKDQVVMPGSHSVYSYDPATGKELWRVGYNGFSNVPRPIFANGLVYVTSGFAPPELLAIRPDGAGDVAKTHVAWRVKKNVPNIPSPVIVGKHLYMVSDKGIATCLDAKDGSEVWSQRLEGGFSASLLTTGKAIFAFNDDGTTYVLQPGSTFMEIGRNSLPGRVQATPAAADGSLFIRTDHELYRIGGK